MFSEDKVLSMIGSHLVHPRHVRPAPGVGLVLHGVGREVAQHRGLSVELVGSGRALAASRGLETGQLVASEAGLPVIRLSHQLLGHQLSREDQILQPRALAFLFGAD